MIAQLTGTIVSRDERSLLIDVHGVGYRVAVHARALEQFAPGVTATVYTHLHVREDAMELYGFATVSEQRLFERLLTVSGVGPKMAIGVLSAASVDDLEAAIDRGDANILKKVSGIGTKTAERIIVDLRGKLTPDRSMDDTSLSAIIDALVTLGYSSREAREAAIATPADHSVEQRIKAALQRMGT